MTSSNSPVYSPRITTPIPATRALTRLFDDNDPIVNISSVLVDPVLVALFHNILNCPTLRYEVTYADISSSLNDGVMTYELHKGLAKEIWTGIKRLSCVFGAAFHDHNCVVNHNPLPFYYPLAPLQALRIDIPGIVLPYIYHDNPLLSAKFLDREGVLSLVQAVQDFYKFYTNYLALLVHRSMILWADNAYAAEGTLANWGAFFGMSKREFYARAGGWEKGYYPREHTSLVQLAGNPRTRMVFDEGPFISYPSTTPKI